MGKTKWLTYGGNCVLHVITAYNWENLLKIYVYSVFHETNESRPTVCKQQLFISLFTRSDCQH